MLEDENDYYMYNGNRSHFREDGSLVNAMNSDMKTMAIEQNMVYILGSISVATLAIAAVMLARGWKNK